MVVCLERVGQKNMRRAQARTSVNHAIEQPAFGSRALPDDDMTTTSFPSATYLHVISWTEDSQRSRDGYFYANMLCISL